jgi:hypothetical protein
MAKTPPEILFGALLKQRRLIEEWAKLSPEEKSIEMKRRSAKRSRNPLKEYWDKVKSGDPVYVARDEERKRKISEKAQAKWNPASPEEKAAWMKRARSYKKDIVHNNDT